MKLRTCVHPEGHFIHGMHRPAFQAENLRRHDPITSLGATADGETFDNRCNFPVGPVCEAEADWIYEIPNPFPFRGATYITRSWAASRALDPAAIALPQPEGISFSSLLADWFKESEQAAEKIEQAFKTLPEPLLLALATTSTDPDDLIRLAELATEFVFTPHTSTPAGLCYAKKENGRFGPLIKQPALFEALANNPHLPAAYKEVMVLRPGAQGGSEIVGEFLEDGGHVFEYLRRNSYIAWGHYAANMASDAIRYHIRDLSETDMSGLRHLYYQRTYVRLLAQLGLELPAQKAPFSKNDLEQMRLRILAKMASASKNRTAATDGADIYFNATLWGWNYGFDFAPTHYRLHASHQQVHQQFALVPASIPAQGYEAGAGEKGEAADGRKIAAFACGDLVADFIREYQEQTGRDFFDCYLKAIRHNQRLDNMEGPTSLVVYEDENVLLFVPKAQTSQWELQLMPIAPVGNILEAAEAVRDSLDRAMLAAMKILTAMGARLITTIEYSKRLEAGANGQRLLYAFLPKLPESPGAFSEAQLRWINGHYPEDFAAACRARLATGFERQ